MSRRVQVQESTRHDQIGVRLGLKDLEKIDALVQVGAYMNRADLVRSAVREKLESVEVLKVRQLPRSRATEEVLEFLRKHGKSYASDVAEALQLDLDLVFSIFGELGKEGLVE